MNNRMIRFVISFILVFSVVFRAAAFADMPPATEYVDFSYMIEGESSANVNQVTIPSSKLWDIGGTKWQTSAALSEAQAVEAAEEAAAREAAIAAGEQAVQAKYGSTSINGMSASALEAASVALAAGGISYEMESFDSDMAEFLFRDMVEPSTWLDIAGFYLDEQGVIQYDNSVQRGINVNGSVITSVAESTETSKFYNFSVESLGRLFSHLHDFFSSGVADGSITVLKNMLLDGGSISSDVGIKGFYSVLMDISGLNFSSFVSGTSSSYGSLILDSLTCYDDLYVLVGDSFNGRNVVDSTIIVFGDLSAFESSVTSAATSWDNELLKYDFSLSSASSYDLNSPFQCFAYRGGGSGIYQVNNYKNLNRVYHLKISDKTVIDESQGVADINGHKLNYNPNPVNNAFENPNYVNDLNNYLETTGYNIPQTENHPEEIGIVLNPVTGIVKAVDHSTLYPDEDIDSVADEEPAVNQNFFDLGSLIAKLAALFAPVISFFKNFVGDFSKLDTSHLNISGLEYIFPFCIPLDVYKMVAIFDVTPYAPVFDFDISPTFEGLGLGSIHIEIDMSEYETPIKVFRYFSLAIFIAAVLRSTRELIRG